MWTFFENGTFYSAVTHTDDQDMMMVRTRDKRSADILADAVGETVLEWPSRDYAYRVIMTRQQWADYVNTQVMNAKATNFKSEVGKNLGYTKGRVWLDALHDTWSVWFDVQHKLKRSEQPVIETDEDIWAEYADWEARQQ